MAFPEGLNGRQEEAVRSDDPRLIILAGPGTGKTRTLTQRIAYLLQERTVPAREILAVTFTRAAAREMRERLAVSLGADDAASDLWVDTFHAAALRVLREEGYPFGRGVEFSVAADAQKAACLEGLIERNARPAFLEDVRRRKQSLELPESGPMAEYLRRLRAANLLDFDDILLYGCRLFDEDPAALARWRTRFRHILVDEFQDTSFAQYAWLLRLRPEHLCVIGDPDQAIYGFMGGSFKPIERFRADFPNGRILLLQDNYRSKAVILEAAKQVIGRNQARLPRDLRARLERGLPLEISAHQTPRQEATMIAKRIEGLLGGVSYFTIDSGWAQKEEESYTYALSDIAILYRFHAQARDIEAALHLTGLPYRTYGKELKENGQKVASAEDLEDVQGLSDCVSAAATGQWVSLMTLHRSKGLEFPVVFIAGCEEGVLPAADVDLEEERRLFYVGMTRAKSRLFLSHARERMLFGRSRQGGSSCFLGDIKEELRLLQRTEPPKQKTTLMKQPDLFQL